MDFLKLVQKIGEEYAEIHFEERKSLSIDFEGKDIENISQVTEYGGNARVFSNGNWGFANFIKPDESENALHKAIRIVKLLPQKSDKIYKSSPIRFNYKDELKFNLQNLSLNEKVDLLKKLYSILTASPKIIHTRINYSELELTKYYFSNEGSQIVQSFCYNSLILSATSKDGENLQEATDRITDRKGEIFEKSEELAHKVRDEAIELLSAQVPEGGVYDVILDQEMAGVFIHEAFGHLSEADFQYKNPALLNKFQLGTLIGAEFLNAVDDGTIKGEFGFFSYDDEGIPSSKTYLIKEGKLSSRLHSRVTAETMGEKPTGNARAQNYTFQPIVRMSCTYIEPTNTTKEELFDSIKRGIYVVGTKGGETGLEQFTFIAKKGYLIENGKKIKLLRNLTLSGNVFETLKNINGIANDLKFSGGYCGKFTQYQFVSTGSPHISIKNVIIGGI